MFQTKHLSNKSDLLKRALGGTQVYKVDQDLGNPFKWGIGFIPAGMYELSPNNKIELEALVEDDAYKAIIGQLEQLGVQVKFNYCSRSETNAKLIDVGGLLIIATDKAELEREELFDKVLDIFVENNLITKDIKTQIKEFYTDFVQDDFVEVKPKSTTLFDHASKAIKNQFTKQQIEVADPLLPQDVKDRFYTPMPSLAKLAAREFKFHSSLIEREAFCNKYDGKIAEPIIGYLLNDVNDHPIHLKLMQILKPRG